MFFDRIKENFLRLPRRTKIIGIGSVLLAVSTLLPWYADLDAYKIGDEFLGVTGPASFVGIVIFLLAGASFSLFLYELLGRSKPKLPVREGILHLFTASESVFLLLIVNSIFFHPKFGVNITLKESRFGMTLAFVSAAILFVGAFMRNRNEICSTDEIGKLEPLIKMESVTGERAHSQVTAPKEERKFSPFAKDSTRGFLFGEPKKGNAPVSAGQTSYPNSSQGRATDQATNSAQPSRSKEEYFQFGK